jgi:hypothetical protein
MALRLAIAIVLLGASAAAAQPPERLAMAGVRLVTDPKVPLGCTTLGTVDDTSVKDLRKKIVRMGGDTALVSFPAADLERINAVVFKCPPPALATPPPPPPPPAKSAVDGLPNIPPPPAGVPPPPPPAASAPQR